jgi:NAD dependent epimerase/dehydratase family enzyme
MMPWIDMHDLLGIVEKVINDESINGAVNATAPNPVNNLEFSKTLAKAMRRPLFLTTPTFLMYVLFGKEMVDELLLKGRSVLPMKIQEHGYAFRFSNLEASMNNLFNKEK